MLVDVFLTHLPSFNNATRAYRLTAAGSPLRKLISTGYGTKICQTLKCPELAVDLLRVVATRALPSPAYIRADTLRDLLKEVSREES